jgi:hypothetical protein
MKQRRAAEYWDTLCNGQGNMLLNASQIMFQGRNQGQKHLSNLQASGQFPSDNTFVTLALSCTVISYTVLNTTLAAGVARPDNGSLDDADLQFQTELHTLVRKALLFIYRIGEKDSYEAHSDSWPAAQGLAGAIALSSSGVSGGPDIAQGVWNNGTVDYGSLLRLGKPEITAARQSFQVEARFSTQATPGATGSVADVLNHLNALSRAGRQDYKHISVRILGVHTRDVQ